MTIQDKLAEAKRKADKIVVMTKSMPQDEIDLNLILTSAARIYDLIEELQGDLANRTLPPL